MSKFELEFDGDIVSGYDTLEDAVASIRKDREAFEEDKAAFPDCYHPEEPFWLDGYRILSPVEFTLD